MAAGNRVKRTGRPVRRPWLNVLLGVLLLRSVLRHSRIRALDAAAVDGR